MPPNVEDVEVKRNGGFRWSRDETLRMCSPISASSEGAYASPTEKLRPRELEGNG